MGHETPRFVKVRLQFLKFGSVIKPCLSADRKDNKIMVHSDKYNVDCEL